MLFFLVLFEIWISQLNIRLHYAIVIFQAAVVSLGLRAGASYDVAIAEKIKKTVSARERTRLRLSQ